MARPRKIVDDEVEVLDAPDVDEGGSSLAEALKKSTVVKVDAYYPPKIRKIGGMDYSNKNMEDFFPDKILKHADFTDTDLSGADFTGFNLQGSIFRNTDFTGTIFRGADLSWSIFSNVNNAKSADWTGAILREVNGLEA